MRLRIIALASVSACCAPGFAFAQDQTATPPPATQPQPAADNPDGLKDIVVTAQRREERLQRVPVSVTAVDNSQLNALRVVNVRDLSGVAPSVQLGGQGIGSNPVIVIRGLASGVSSNSVDPKVGVYLDGVYIGRSTGSLFDLADIQRVEILRGPQGTLFGRNATAGAVSLVSAEPSGKFGLRVIGSYGNYNAWRGKATLDLPSFGPFSVKLAYLHDQIDGDVRNLMGGMTLNETPRDPSFGTLTFAKRLGGRNVDGGQVSVRGDFGKLVADYRFDYSDMKSVGRAAQSQAVIPDATGQLLQPIVDLQPFFGGVTNIASKPLDAVANATSVEHVKTWGHSLTLTLNANDNLTVKSITAIRGFKQYPQIYDIGASGGLRLTPAQLGAFLTPGLTPAQIQGILFDPANLPKANDYFFGVLSSRSTKQTQFSQELQFQLTNKAFDLTAGLFYFHENSPATDIQGALLPTPGGVNAPNIFDAFFGSGVTRTRAINDSMAGYGQFTLHVSDKFDLTAGLRGTVDDRHLDILEIAGVAGGSLGVGKYNVSYSRLTYTGIATWRPVQDTMVYAKIASGYVAGGILSGIPFRPETLVTYELGMKTQLFDNRARINASAYYSNYKDLQNQNYINGIQYFTNAGRADIKGFEVEAQVMPVRGLVLNGNVGYTDVDYKKFIFNGVDVADIARPQFTSKWTARVGAQYDSPDIGGGMHFQAIAQGSYRSSFYLSQLPSTGLNGQPVLDNLTHLPGYWLVDGRLGLVDVPIGGSKVSISAFGKNLFDKRYILFGAPALMLTASYERGRTYGVELGFSF